MVITAVTALALAQPAEPDRPLPMLECSLVTPAGDAVGFMEPAWDESSDEITLVAAAGAVWPTRTLPGQRGIMTGAPRAPRMFAFGSGDGLALDVGDARQDPTLRSATLYRRDRQRIGLPVAFGFCTLRPQPPSMIYRAFDENADPRDIGSNISAFSSAQWPTTHCSLILSDGRRLPFQFSLEGQDSVRLSSSELWAGRPITMDIRWGTSDGDQAGTFARRGGPEGFQLMKVVGSSAVKLIWLRRIDGPSGSHRSGFGICGYNQIVRRPGP